MSNPIKNTEKVKSMLAEAQHLARTRTIELADIVDELGYVDARLALVSSKTDAIGTVVSIDAHAKSFPNAYHGIPESTHFTAKLTRTGWEISRIWRGQTYGPTRRCVITYTDATRAKMADRLSVL